MATTNPNGTQNTRARVAVTLIVFGFFVFFIGLFPGVIRMDLTPGIGLLKISTFLFGISIMTLGGYLYVSTTRHQAGPHRLGEAIGVRLMGTGLVICYVTGYADVLGIGTERPGEPLILGPIQALGIVIGVLVIIGGIFIYASR